MGLAHDTERLGPPDLAIAGFQVWVHGQPRAGSGEPYDADWLTVTAHCGAAGASVWVRGDVLTASSFARFARECDSLHASLTGVAELASLEPDIRVTLAAEGTTGHVSMVVEITPDIAAQEHRFEFAIDQSYLPEVTRQCRAVLARYADPFAGTH